MDMIRGLLRPRAEINIPQFEADDKVDLLVKALFYMFRRIDLLEPYQASSKIQVQVPGLSDEDLENLDKMYNKTKFVQVVYQNKHRILTDWPQNKFRSLLILSHTPQMEELPQFPGNFKFTVLSPESSNDEYIKSLSESAIYVEHHLPLELRRKMVQTLLARYPQRDLTSRAQIIASYVELLAVEVQVARLYKAAVQDGRISSPLTSPQGSLANSPMHSPTHSPIHTPVGSPVAASKHTYPGQSSPTLASKPSRIRLDERDTPKLKSKPSLSGLRLSPTLKERSPSPTLRSSRSPSPARSSPNLRSPSPSRENNYNNGINNPSPPPSPTRKLRLKASSSNLKGAPNLAISQEPKKVLLDQSRLAVQARLKREEQLLYK